MDWLWLVVKVADATMVEELRSIRDVVKKANLGVKHHSDDCRARSQISWWKRCTRSMEFWKKG